MRNNKETHKKTIEIKAFELGEMIQEVGLAVQTALITLNPLTNALFTSFSDWNTRKGMRQLDLMIRRLSDRLTMIESTQKGYLQSDEFKELLYKACHKVLADLREEKAQLFADFLAGTVLHDAIHSSDSFMMLEVLEKLELEHLDFMAKMEPHTFDPQEIDEGWTDDEDDLKELCVDKARFYLLSDYLSNLGLVSRLEKFRVDAETGYLQMWRAYYLSTFGKKLLDVIRFKAE